MKKTGSETEESNRRIPIPTTVLNPKDTIEDRTWTGEALRKSEEKYRALVENLDEGISFVDPSERFTFANPAAERIFGVPSGTLAGRSLKEFVSGEDFAQVERETGKRMQGARNRYRLNMIRADGEVRCIQVTATPYRDGEGRFGGTFGVFDDITAQVEAEAALRTAKEYAENLIQTANAIVIGLDAEGNINIFNRTAERITGYSGAELANRNWFEVLVPKDRYPEAWANFEGLQKDGLPRNMESPILTKDGRERTIAWQSSEVREQGKVVGSISFGIDLTERKRAEEENRHLAEMLDCAPSSVIVYDSDGRQLFSNQTACDMHGYSRAEFRALNLDRLNAPESGALIGSRMQGINKNGMTTFEVTHLRKDGTTFPLEATVRMTTWGGRRVVIGVGTDITERKRVEEAKEKLEAQNRQLEKDESLGRMAGAIAHNFNNLLMGVLGNLELALPRLPVGSPELRFLNRAMTASRRAADISQLMLTYLGHDRVLETKKPADLSVLCRGAMPSLLSSLPAGVHVATAFPPSGPRTLANAAQIKQVLSILMTNAGEATGESAGSITVTVGTTPPAEIPLSSISPVGWKPDESPYACLTVCDTGCGMGRETLEKIFEPFFTTKFVGRGLGLPVVLGVLKSLEGAVAVESAPGKGSTFRLFLPVSVEVSPQSGKTEKIESVPSGDGTQSA